MVVAIGDHGWQLGEHGEWAKHTDFGKHPRTLAELGAFLRFVVRADDATRVPMILHVPGVTDRPRMARTTAAFVELVDVMATLTDYAGISVPELCPANPNCVGMGCSSAAVDVRLCTEGQSLRTVVEACSAGPSVQCDGAGKLASFSVYPHYGYNTPFHQVNGYSMTTRMGGVEYRYTEWVPFDVPGSLQWWTPDYNPARSDQVTAWCAGAVNPGRDPQRCNAARELYNHDADPEENRNLAELSSSIGLVQALSAQLRAGWRSAMGGGGH